MFKHIVGFEWRYQVKSPVFWIGSIIFFLLTFGATTVDTIQIGSRGNVNINSPFAIIQTLATMSLFMVFIVVAMVANVVIRDDETGFAPILRSTSVSKASYLIGRFVGANLAALVVMASIPLAIAVGSAMPWLDSDKVGPFHPGDYLYALFVFGLPSLLIISAAFFALATATRSMMWTYVGAVTALVLYLVMRGLLRDPQYDAISALADPFGLSAIDITTRYWTAAERNTMLPPLTGALLANRALWSGVGIVCFAITYRLFHFEQREGTSARAAKAGTQAVEPPPAVMQQGRLPAPRADAATRRAQLWRLVRFDMAFVLKSPAFFVLLAIGVLNSAGSLWFTGELYGSGSYPVTRLMVQTLNGAFTLMPIIIAIFYAGELVWRDRERRMHEIVDATAAPDWSHLLPKMLAIAVVLTISICVAVVTAIGVQTAKGYFHYQLGAYALWFVLPTVINAMLLAVLAVFVQVLVPQKFIGWALMLLYVVSTVAMNSAGFEHNLYNYSGTSPVPLSDFNGMDRFWIGQAWFQVYWAGFATMLAVLAHGLWRRGANSALKPRLRQLPRRLRGLPSAIFGAGAVVWIGCGAFIFYNTNVLNRYLTRPDHDARLARIEKTLLPFERVPQPKIAAVTLAVQIYPKEARAVSTGSYRLQNRTAQPIDTLHVDFENDLNESNDVTTVDSLAMPGATLQKDYGDLLYRIYKLDPPMQPGETRTLQFRITIAEHGFPNGAPLTRIVTNGTFLDNSEIAPGIGMTRNSLLKDRSKRRKYGLPPDLRPPKLEDDSARAFNELGRDSDWVDADFTVTTDADQMPMAPGYTVSDSTANGRRSVRFKPDAPMVNLYSIQSARYAQKHDKVTIPFKDAGKDIDLAVYYQPGHAWNVDRMLAAMKLSLAMYSERFSPYQFHQARILEFPAYADFAESFANTIPYSENLGFLFKLDDPSKIDMVTYVTAHEIAHQWWGHQLAPSDQQGAAMLSESFAQYSALLVMEKMYGRDQVRRFTKYELDRYLRARGGETVEELPLARVENQGYIHYRKGTLVMYWLRESLGEDVVDRAMAQLLKQYAFKGAPYANTRDFIALLRAEVGPGNAVANQTITDLLEKITLYDVKVTDATAARRADGRYDVHIAVDAKKLYADGFGKETEAPLDEPFEVGVFTAQPGDKGFVASSVLSFARLPLHSGKQVLDVVVDKAPTYAGVDPYNKRIDRNSDDNLKKVEMK